MIKLEPLKGKKAFSDLFESGKRFGDSECSAVVRFTPNYESKLDSIRFAVVISKKNAKKAVLRNRIKRLLRESLRHVAKESELSVIPTAIDTIIIIWKKAPEKPMLIGLSNVIPAVRRLIKRASDYSLKKSSEAKESEDNKIE